MKVAMVTPTLQVSLQRARNASEFGAQREGKRLETGRARLASPRLAPFSPFPSRTTSLHAPCFARLRSRC